MRNNSVRFSFLFSLAGLRRAAQYLSFGVLTYGGNFGIRLGSFLPCFSCPFISGCAGRCYFRRLQYDLLLPVADVLSGRHMDAVYAFLAMLGLLMLLGKSWCGWICPMGLAQEWVTKLRNILGIREAEISPELLRRLGGIKYLVLAWFVVIVPAIFHIAGEQIDLYAAMCGICPGRTIMPLFELNTYSWAIVAINPTSAVLSGLLSIFTGITLAGIFFKDRFFCLFCPMAAMMHLFKPLLLLRLVKTPPACHGCGNCRRGCPMNIQSVHDEREKIEVQADGCMGCFHCVDTCAGAETLSIKFGPFVLFSSSRANAAGLTRLFRRKK